MRMTKLGLCLIVSVGALSFACWCETKATQQDDTADVKTPKATKATTVIADTIKPFGTGTMTTFTQNVTINKDLTTTGNTTNSGTLSVTGATKLNGGLALDTNKFVVANGTGNTTVGGTLDVKQSTTLEGTLDVYENTVLNKALTVAGQTTLNGLSVNGPASFNEDITLADGKAFVGNLTGNADTATRADSATNFDIAGTLGVTGESTLAGNTTVGGTLNARGDLTVNTDKFNVTALSGNTTIGGTLDVDGDIAVNTSKFVVEAASGDTIAGGTLDAAGDFAVNTSKFVVTAASGNTVVGGTLDVTGDLAVNTNKFIVTSASGNTAVVGDFSVNANKFNVTAATGDTTVGGTLDVDGDLSVNGIANFSENITLADGKALTGNLIGNADTATNADNADSATNFTGALSGDVTGNQHATVVASVGGISAGWVASGVSAANAATDWNTEYTIVKRDHYGNFSAGTITADLAGNADTATRALDADTAFTATYAVRTTNADNAANFSSANLTLVGDLGVGGDATIDGNFYMPAEEGLQPKSSVTTRENPSSAAISPQSNFIAVATTNTIQIFHVDASGNLSQTEVSHTHTQDNPSPISWAPSGNFIAVYSYPQGIQIFGVDSSGHISSAEISHTETGVYPTSISWAPLSNFVATVNSDDNTVQIFSVSSTGQISSSVVGQATTGAEPYSVAFSPNWDPTIEEGDPSVGGGFVAVTNYESYTVQTFKVDSTGSILFTINSQSTEGHPKTVAFSPNGNYIAVSNEDSHSIQIFGVNSSGQISAEVSETIMDEDPRSLCWAPSWTSSDGGLLSVATNYNIQIFSVDDSGQISTSALSSQVTDYQLLSHVWSQLGNVIAAIGGNNTLNTFKVGSGVYNLYVDEDGIFLNENTTINGTLSVNGVLTLNDGALITNDDVTIGGLLDITGTAPASDPGSPSNTHHFFGQKIFDSTQNLSHYQPASFLTFNFANVAGDGVTPPLNKGAFVKLNALIVGKTAGGSKLSEYGYESTIYIAPGDDSETPGYSVIFTETTNRLRGDGNQAYLTTNYEGNGDSGVLSLRGIHTSPDSCFDASATGTNIIIFYEIMSDNLATSNTDEDEEAE